jgi:two-component system sensor histidine kinase BarA
LQIRYNVLILLLFMVYGLSAKAADISVDQKALLLTANQYSYFIDESKDLTLVQIQQRFSAFTTVTGKNPNFNFSQGALWLKFDIENLSDYREWFLELTFAQNDYVDLYVLYQGGVLTKDKLGRLSNDTQFRYPTLNFEMQPGEHYQLLVKVINSSSLITPVQLIERQAHAAENYLEAIFWGGFYGGLLLLMIYNIVLSIGWQNGNSISYGIYICAVLLWEFIWGGHVQVMPWTQLTEFLVARTDLFFLLLAFSASLFTIRFLQTARSAPKLHRIILIWMTVNTIVAVISELHVLPPLEISALIYFCSMVSVTLLFMAAIESFLNDFVTARYFVFAWGIVLLAAFAGLASLIGVLPSNVYTTYCFQVSVVIEACLFSLAMAQRVQSSLQEDVDLATDELRNNLEFIELQNAELHIARKKATQASKIKSQFLANMSHEIRTPLNSIVGFSRELKKRHLADSDSELAEIINSSASHLVNVVNDILDVSKIEAGKIELESQPFNLCELTQEIASIYAPQAFNKDVEFIYDAKMSQENWLGDALRIRQIITNLLSNSIKFTDSGAITLSIENAESGDITIEISDTGIGMTEEQQQHVFDAFAQADNSTTRKFGGTGLGLLISRELCKMMSGDIKVSSKPNKGTQILVQLSLEPAEEPQAEALLDQKNVFVYDDDKLLQKIWLDAIVRDGGNAFSTNSPDWRLQSYDAILIGVRAEGTLPEFASVFANQQCVKAAVISPSSQIKDISTEWTIIDKPLFVGKIVKRLNATHQVDVERQVISLDGKLSGIHILVADDIPLNMRLINHWLENSGATLHTAEDGAEAFDKAQQRCFDLILMDIQMPVLDGMQATVKIRNKSLNKETPIIAVTAHAFKEEKDRMRAAGMDDVLTKPLDEDEFIRVLAKWTKIDVTPFPIQKHKPLTDESIDWQYAVSHANNNEDIAKDIFKMFLAKLPQHVDSIKQALEGADSEDVLQKVHKFHGACCYTGVPKLRALCYQIESLLKKGEVSNIDGLFEALFKEAERLPLLAKDYL